MHPAVWPQQKWAYLRAKFCLISVLCYTLVLRNCITRFFISALIDIAQVRASAKCYKIKILSIFSTFWFYKQYAQNFAGEKIQLRVKLYMEHSGTYSLYSGYAPAIPAAPTIYYIHGQLGILCSKHGAVSLSKMLMKSKHRLHQLPQQSCIGRRTAQISNTVLWHNVPSRLQRWNWATIIHTTAHIYFRGTGSWSVVI